MELVEDEGGPGTPDGAFPPDATDGSAPGRRVHGRRARWIGIGVVVALAVVVVGANVGQARDDAARRAAWAELDWMAPDLAEPLQELWRAQGTGVMMHVGDVLLVQDASYSRPQAIRAVDLNNGEVLWEATGWAGFPSCSLVGADDAPATELYCAVWSPGEFVEDEERAADVVEVVFLDLATGRLTGTVTVPGVVHGIGDIDGDLVVLVATPEGGASVARIATATRSVVWTQAVDIEAPESAWLGVGLDDVSVYFEDGRSVRLDASTGEPMAARDLVGAGPAGQDWVEILPGWRWFDTSQVWHGRAFTFDDALVDDALGDGPPRVQVHAPDGSVLYPVEGTPVLPWHDDSQGPDVLVVAETGSDGWVTSGLTGLDGATGAERWTADPPGPPEACMQVGELMVWCGNSLAVLDVRTGALLWRETTSYVAPVTDGERLLAASRDRVFGDRGSEMVDSLSARDLRTGEMRWSIEPPGEVVHLEVRGGVVIVSTPDALIAYG